jgi:hypothetical protein
MRYPADKHRSPIIDVGMPPQVTPLANFLAAARAAA